MRQHAYKGYLMVLQMKGYGWDYQIRVNGTAKILEAGYVDEEHEESAFREVMRKVDQLIAKQVAA